VNFRRAIIGICLVMPENLAILQMGRRFFLLCFNVNNPVRVQRHFRMIDTSSLFSRIEKDHAHGMSLLDDIRIGYLF